MSDICRHVTITFDLRNIPSDRLKSRHPIWKEDIVHQHFSAAELWQSKWNNANMFNKELIEDPTKEVPGFDLPRKQWSTLNRFRTCHGRCNDMLFKWNAVESPSCDCGAPSETIKHMVEECPVTMFEGGFVGLHRVTEMVLNWMSTLKPL